MQLIAARIKYGFIRWSGVLAFLLLWEAAPRLGWVDAQFLPVLSTILLAVEQLALDGSLYTHLVVSLWRALTGLVLAAVVAVPLAFLLEGWFSGTARRLDPLFRLLSHVNPFSLAPVFILFFGIGETQKLAIISLVTVWPILFHTITGIRSVDPLLVKTARSLQVSRFRLARDVLFPAALPTIITGLRIGTQMAVFMLVAAEMLGAGAGMGWLVHNSAMNYQIPRMYAGGIFIILLGILINQFILHWERESLFQQTPPDAAGQRPEPRQVINRGGSHLPIAVGIMIGILFFGAQEVGRINREAAASGFPAEHHNHHGAAADAQEKETMPGSHNHHIPAQQDSSGHKSHPEHSGQAAAVPSFKAADALKPQEPGN
ncbi:hypothetical protein P22_3197 [Propionispora sp. 2/2-37]|uniref:ABC transporter permease n=1 Tax=Propionispora sp. 2/2-37 TaxID=1677858 RepID=UPI0006C22049|nr:ABC transporter permease [Propionispora sp. 2/2-37]CUH97071.1 hypothetical protein P22_3197 [Propionispora sp. 2/2-37]